jgi:hypothetical protein
MKQITGLQERWSSVLTSPSGKQELLRQNGWVCQPGKIALRGNKSQNPVTCQSLEIQLVWRWSWMTLRGDLSLPTWSNMLFVQCPSSNENFLSGISLTPSFSFLPTWYLSYQGLIPSPWLNSTLQIRARLWGQLFSKTPTSLYNSFHWLQHSYFLVKWVMEWSSENQGTTKVHLPFLLRSSQGCASQWDRSFCRLCYSMWAMSNPGFSIPRAETPGAQWYSP